MKPVALFLAAALAVGTASACDRSADRGQARPMDRSPGVASTANLPAAPNDAATGASTMNTPNAIVGGQIPDWSNPTPSGLPAASPAMH